MNDIKTTTTDDFEKLTAELGEFSRVSNELAKMDAEFQATMQELIAECFTKDFSGLKAELAAAEERIELLALRHPEWFAKVKTIKTPYGTVASRKTTKLEMPNEELTLALLDSLGQRLEPFVKVERRVSLEGLETLEDAELARLKVTRVVSEKISITPAKIDLGKAVKSAE